jgi:hypothetical protein
MSVYAKFSAIIRRTGLRYNSHHEEEWYSDLDGKQISFSMSSHKRSLRVVKWIGMAPAEGVCTYCAKTFKVPLDLLQWTSDAQGSLRKQFEEHKCEKQEAPRIVKEAAEDP